MGLFESKQLIWVRLPYPDQIYIQENDAGISIAAITVPTIDFMNIKGLLMRALSGVTFSGNTPQNGHLRYAGFFELPYQVICWRQ